ncbi:Putative alkyl/aryl-sulfatase YjcS [Paraburkholderia caffeinitolerans]|uniref:Alkyl/aryl-sulfatase YjcS n=1 Tax=Paraburkholderia caffeinitolerans TaxID=1723730 RepID=A0A6J5G8X1_9BURK|nr:MULTISPECIES: alkyl sulfatase dimerization domain-containing protein [Paraburkholderia]CAB3793878.1 Putative alkyl/aryl-sulfatase YjcS [Paraburkholderia caffeinitolerans]
MSNSAVSQPAIIPQPGHFATKATLAAHERALRELPPADPIDEAEARRGFIGTIPDAEVRDAYGRLVWSLADYAFLDDPQAPATAHPALWRQARLNATHGLFEVTERIYQVRGFDLSNMTIIEGDTGLIIIDPLSSRETAQAALELYLAHRPKREVAAVIYSHSHTDHYGGVKGVISESDVRAGKVQVIAPDGFMEEAVSESILAGTAMARRGQFQFGHTLARNACCQIDAGLGKTVPRGALTLIEPTLLIREESETHVIDGIEIVFQLTPDSEAPAEMHFFFPQLRALNLAENGTKTLHNLCPLRGTKVRNAQLWSRYLGRSLERYAPHADVAFAQHHWPTWGTGRITMFLEQQRDLYKFLHDQTLRLMNHGLTAPEIAERMRLPDSLAAQWHAHGYYGTVSHNVKAIYQHYLSWYDGNPSNLHALPPEMSAPRYVEYMGGAQAMLERARRDFERGEYRWVAQVMNHLVFAQPTLHEARELGAAALEQMGFQAESATWRNAFLLGARELREGLGDMPSYGKRSADMVSALTDEMFFDYLAMRIDGFKAQALDVRVAWRFTDTDRHYALTMKHGALTCSTTAHTLSPHVTVTMTRDALNRILIGQTGFAEMIGSEEIHLDGDASVFLTMLGMLDTFDGRFNIVEP